MRISRLWLAVLLVSLSACQHPAVPTAPGRVALAPPDVAAPAMAPPQPPSEARGYRVLDLRPYFHQHDPYGIYLGTPPVWRAVKTPDEWATISGWVWTDFYGTGVASWYYIPGNAIVDNKAYTYFGWIYDYKAGTWIQSRYNGLPLTGGTDVEEARYLNLGTPVVQDKSGGMLSYIDVTLGRARISDSARSFVADFQWDQPPRQIRPGAPLVLHQSVDILENGLGDLIYIGFRPKTDKFFTADSAGIVKTGVGSFNETVTVTSRDDAWVSLAAGTRVTLKLSFGDAARDLVVVLYSYTLSE